MPIDPSIALAVKSPTFNIADPIEQFGQILSLRNLMQTGQMGQLDLQTKQLALEQERRRIQEQQNIINELNRGSAGASVAPPPAPPLAAPPGAPLGSLFNGGSRTVNYGWDAQPASPPALSAAPPAAAPPAPAAAAPTQAPPSMGNEPGLIGHLSASDIWRLAPTSGLPLMKQALELKKDQLDLTIKHHDEQQKRWAAMAGAGQAVLAAQNPEAEWKNQLVELYNGGTITPQELAAFRDHGYDPAVLKGWTDRAVSQADFHTIQKTDAETRDKNWDLAVKDAANVSDQPTFTAFLTRHPELRPVLGNTYSSDAITAFRFPTIQPGERFQQAATKTAQTAQLLSDRSQIPDFIKQQPTEFQPSLQKLYDSGLPLDQFKQYAGLTATKPEAGVTVPKPAPVVAQEIATDKAKELVKADPFGLFAEAAGTPTAGAPGAPGGGSTPSPLAQAIANFEGFNKADSVAQRNNNPGNLRAGPGQSGTDKNGYAIFPDVTTGWAALHDLIQKRSADNLTLQEFFGGKKGVYPGYAPAADRNDPANYAATVAGQLGVDPTAKLSDIPGGQMIPAAAKRITPDMHGQDVLDALPGPFAQMVKGYAEGRLTFPTGRALTSPFMQQMLGLVGQYDPLFDASNPGKRSATAKAFAVGKEGQQVNAINTAIGHVDDLSKSADKLNNAGWPAYNTVANFISKQTGSNVVTNFDTVKKAVVDELTRVWRGTGGSEQDIKSWAESLDASNSPAQLHGAIAKIGGLLESKLGALEDQYHEGMGTISQGRHMITPEARKTLNKLEQKAGGTPAAAAGPAVGTVEDGYRFNGGDPSKPENWVKQ